MALYQLPQSAQNGFKKIINLDEKQMTEVTSIISKAGVGTGVNEIVVQNENGIPGLNGDNLATILVSLFGLVNTFTHSNQTVDKFLENLVNSYGNLVEAPSENELKLLRERLAIMLSSFSHIRLTVKARDLMIDNACNFDEARIVSDIRIVFDDNSELQKEEQYALIVHHLNMSYFSQSQNDNKISIALDLTDLYRLRETIDRAIEKDKSIRSKNHVLEFIDLKD